LGIGIQLAMNRTRSKHECFADKTLSNICHARYLMTVKMMPQSMPMDPEKLKPLLHEKIEQMNVSQLSVFNRVLLQVEAEELADRLAGAFDRDHEEGKLSRISELVKKFRAEHRYA